VGVELLLGAVLGFLVLGPRRMHELLGRVGQAKALLDKTSRGIKVQLAAELGTEPAAQAPGKE